MAVQFDAVKEMTDSLTKVFERRNWLLGAPVLAGIFIMYVVIIVVGLIVIGPQWFKIIASGGSQTPDVTPAFAVGFAIGMTVFVLFVLAVNMFTYAWTLGAAVGVWQGHDPAFDRGFNLAAVKLVRLVAYQILVGLLAIVSIITIVGPIIIGVLSIYGPAYIVLGNRSATAAIGDSFRLASENIGPTVVLVLGFVVAVVAAIIPVTILGLIPGVGLVVQLAFQWLFAAWVAVAVVRFYELLTITTGEPPFALVPETRA